MSSGNEGGLSRLAEAITDEIPIDWDSEVRDHPELADRLPALRLLSRIAEVCNPETTGATAMEPAGETWGPLQILETLGEGNYGVVYRARDHRLQRDVALKLLKGDPGGDRVGARRFLAEARLMARVKHPNVLVIHGADELDGRIGFWTDLLDGETLEARLAGGEILGAGEAALYGRELCRALGAVHGAGLVHGDVKAANVMRDRDGRIVLTDFGAGVERGAGVDRSGPLRGTPLVLAPEILDGGEPSPAGDLYALGVLLYRLVAGRYPIEAQTLTELRRLHAGRKRVPLMDLRPDLPAGFVGVVEKALFEDPARRFASAGEMEAALAATLRTASERTPGRRGRLLFAAAALAVLATATAVVLFDRSGLRLGGSVVAPQSVVPLTASAVMIRTGGDFVENLADGALVRPGDTLGLSLRLGAVAHVYVLNEDRQGAVFVLFPLDESELCNPLPRDRNLRLPGTWQGTVLNWRVTEGQGEERFLVIAAREPLGWLESRFADFAVPTRDRSLRLVRPGLSPEGPERGVGVVVEKDAAQEPGGSVLAGLAARLAEEGGDHSRVWISELMLYNLGR